jgi:hypothetical protein
MGVVLALWSVVGDVALFWCRVSIILAEDIRGCGRLLYLSHVFAVITISWGSLGLCWAM